MNEDNLKLYNDVREVPQEAIKKIGGGRLKGFSNINPMWRIKKLTELFGICGFGWKYEVIDKRIVEGANDEKAAFLDLNLFVKVDGKWSEPIFGTGGSSFVSKERSGLNTSDEAFKMALTDALSVACKSLGVGADVYFENDSDKYSRYEEQPQQPQQPQQYREPTQKSNQTQPSNEKEVLKSNIVTLLNQKNIDFNRVTDYLMSNYRVKTLNELNINQIKILENKIKNEW